VKKSWYICPRFSSKSGMFILHFTPKNLTDLFLVGNEKALYICSRFENEAEAHLTVGKF